jgi:hypothetical protein
MTIEATLNVEARLAVAVEFPADASVADTHRIDYART